MILRTKRTNPAALETVVKVEQVQSGDGSIAMNDRSLAKELRKVDPNLARVRALSH